MLAFSALVGWGCTWLLTPARDLGIDDRLMLWFPVATGLFTVCSTVVLWPAMRQGARVLVLTTGLLWCLQVWIGTFYLLFLVPLAFSGGLGPDSW